MSVHTRSQKLAQAAYARIARHTSNGTKKPDKEFVSFVKKFPALIHTCGLSQAVAFALAKKEKEYVADLTVVLQAAGHAEITDQQPLDHQAQTQPLGSYLRLSRDAISAASWLKRYVEAVAGEEE
jgi:CRISPR type III-B/RAMP module-associated protein Cmr5